MNILKGTIMVEYNFKRLSKMAKDKGFKVVRVKGSHHQFFNADLNELVTIPNHGNSPIAKGTAQKIIKALGY
jgi:predicted RNA binding protein YcfA (HicA-like mRNA interferase family)